MRRFEEIGYRSKKMMIGGSCFGLFPLLLYYAHKENELKQIREETLAELYTILEKIEAENSFQVTE